MFDDATLTEFYPSFNLLVYVALTDFKLFLLCLQEKWLCVPLEEVFPDWFYYQAFFLGHRR